MNTAELNHAELVREVKRLKRRCKKLEELVETAWHDGHATSDPVSSPTFRGEKWMRSQTLGTLRRICDGNG